MFKISKKTALIAFIVALCSSNLLNAWGHFGAVLHDQKTGHIVRLLGDRHAESNVNGNEDKIEAEFIKNIRLSLENHLSNKKSGIFIVECGSIKGDQYKKVDMTGNDSVDVKIKQFNNRVQELFDNNPLIEQMLDLSAGSSYEFCRFSKKPCVPIIAFDFRAYTSIFDLFDAMESVKINLQSNHPELFDEVNKTKKAFSIFCKNFSKAVDEYSCEYSKEFSLLLDHQLKISVNLAGLKAGASSFEA